MNRLASESIIPAQTSLYHWSKNPTELLASGAFDPSRSNHDGAMFFTMEPTPRSNVVAIASEGLRVFDHHLLTSKETVRLNEIGEGSIWLGAATLGYVGRLYDNPDPFAEVSPGEYAVELAIFEHGLQKIASIRAYQA